MRNEKFASQPVVQVTQEPNWRVHHAVQRLKYLVEQSDKALADFRKTFDQNPVSAFDWSLSAFYHANQRQLVVSLLENLEDAPTQETIDELCSHITDEILRTARRTPSSSSATSNINDNCRREAYCNVLDYLKAYSSENISK